MVYSGRCKGAYFGMPSEILPVGRVVATELKPSTPHQFHFWTARDTPIGIGAIVRVQEHDRIVFGVVTDGFAYSDIVTPMHAVIGADGDPVAAGEEPSARAEIRLFTAAVLRQMPEEPLQPVPLGPVWLADDADVLLARIFQTFPAHKGSVAALCFNVKGPDLCFLDQPAALSEEDRGLYQRLGL